MNASAKAAAEIRISSDSHMGEPPDLWEKGLPPAFRDRALHFPDIKPFETNHHLRAGCWDPHERLKDQAVDGVAAEVLYPTLGQQAWLVGDVELEEACVRVYNDWMIDFCSVAPDHHWGLALISLRNIEHAVEELERCRKAGLRGATIWIAPPAELPYTSDHYERFWAAAQKLETPLAMHINSRASASSRDVSPLRQMHSVNGHKFDAMRALGDLIGSGVLERYPRLKLVVAEVGAGWIPFWLQEFDYYTAKGGRSNLPMPPSEYFWRQVCSTFISDEIGVEFLPERGKDNFLWSSDYPHPACLWPDSVQCIDEDLGHLTPEVRGNVIANTVARLYNNGRFPPPLEHPGEDYEADARVWARENPEFGATARPKTVVPGAR